MTSTPLARAVLSMSFIGPAISLTHARRMVEEADWLSGEMLIPYDGAYRLARANATDHEVAEVFDVSLAVARWRMNHSGARKVVERTRAKWASRQTPQCR